MAQSSERETSGTVTLRTATAPQTAEPRSGFSDHRDNVIVFKHPGYPDHFGQNILLTLYAFDLPGGALHYATAHCACALIACNAWDGYLTATRDGPRLQIGNDNLLTEKTYYFHVPSEIGPRYPIYPAFDHWAYPHDRLPEYWPRPLILQEEEDELGAAPSASTLTAAVLKRDKACLVSGYRDYIQKAHLCPRNNAEWFQRNGLSQFNLNRQLARDNVVDDGSNVIALRPDIHSAFDDMKFVIVPKKGRWVTHFMDRTNDFGRLYHNVPLQIHQDVSIRCLLVRFAWAIFPSVVKFLEAGPSRIVRVRVTAEDEYREITQKMDVDELRANVTSGRKRSTSPKKRKGEDMQEEDGGLYSYHYKSKRIRTSTVNLLDEALTLTSQDTATFASLHNPCKSSRSRSTPDTLIYSNPSSYEEDATQPVENLTDRQREDLKHAWLVRQRPSNISLFCCDYNAAEAAQRAGVSGPPVWGGSHLCDKCLGNESD